MTTNGLKHTGCVEGNESNIVIKEGLDDDSDIVKAYKEKPYFNSNKEPFGLTLNGKGKEYICAHGMIKGLIKR